MLKYEEIIKRLSEDEKIGILCDIRRLSDPSLREKGVPSLGVLSVSETGAGVYPPPEALANSWDLSLVSETARAAVGKAAENADLLTVPAPRAGISPYVPSLSEDPLLAKSLALGYFSAASDARLSVCTEGFGISDEELAFADREPDERFLREFLMKPYDSLSGAECAALLMPPVPHSEAYGAWSAGLFRAAEENASRGGARPICAYATAEQTVPFLLEGKLFFEGSSFALSSALSRYKKLERAVLQGAESGEVLSREISSGKAISPEALDAAVDRLLAFVFSVKRKHRPSDGSADAALALDAVRRSLVLLKNENGVLPLKGAKRIALIGDVAFPQNDGRPSPLASLEKALQARGQETVGAERGYLLGKTRNEDMIAPAVALAEKADAVILFLGIGAFRAARAGVTEKISLPANQLALLDALGAYREKLVAVLPSEEPWDIVMRENCAAILTMPLFTGDSGEVLADTLTGLWNPCGRLARTVYVGTEARARRRRTVRERDGLRTGVFVGYRSYVTSGESVGFPMGHGLSYTRFVYTDLSVKDGTACVTVRNKGKTDGTETVQIYAGKPDSAVLRPQRELVGFGRISLKPGEKGTVRIPLSLPEVWSRERGASVTEAGRYEIFAAASAEDIRLSRVIASDGETLAPDGGRISDYIHTKSNIISDHYKLEAKIGKMKRSVFNWIAGSAAMLMAIVLKQYCSSAGAESRFFVWFEAVLCALGLWILLAEAIRRSAMRKSERELREAANEKLFESAERIGQYNAAEMFAQEFDRDEAAPREEKETYGAEVGDTEYFAGIEREQSFASAASEFAIFARERGCLLRDEDVRALFASLSSSRLVIFEGLEERRFRKLTELLAEYFESVAFTDAADGSYTCGESVLFRTGARAGKIATGVSLAIESARTASDKMHFASLTGVRGETLCSYFAPYMAYIRHPARGASVRIVSDTNAESFHYIPRNVWFLLNASEGEAPCAFPAEITAAAAFCALRMESCPSSEAHTAVKRFSYYQMEFLKERMNAYSPDEALWKRLDRLEESVSRTAPYEIDNKHWLGIEDFACAYVACGGTESEAVDEAAASRLIVPIVSAWMQASADLRELETLMEKTFGEEDGEACKKRVRACISDTER